MNEEKIISFKTLEKEYKDILNDDKETKKNERIAEEYFLKAKESDDNSTKYELAHTAFTLCPYRYHYEVYAVLFLKKEQKLEALKRIYNYVNNENNPYFKDDEQTKARYGYFIYTYACTLLDYKYTDEALELLTSIIDNYYRFKAVHLILNIYIYQSDYQEATTFYEANAYEEVASFIPISYAYLKLNKYKEFVYLIKKIQTINPHFLGILNEANEYRLENCSNDNYKIADSSEIYYAFKYFYNIYHLDQEYLKAVNNILNENA